MKPDTERNIMGGPVGSPFYFKQRGFSLLEVIMVIALIAVTYAVALPDLTMLESTAVSNKLHRFASDIRGAYDLTVLSNKVHRMAFDPIKGEYWLEYTDKEDFRLGVSREGRDLSAEEEQNLNEAFDESFQEYIDVAEKEVTVENSENPIIFKSPLIDAKEALRPASWVKVENSEWRGRNLSPELMVRSMQAEHHENLQVFDQYGEDTRFYLYFFPNGYVEKAFFHIYYRGAEDLPNEEREPYTLITDSYKGVADYSTGRLEVDVHSDKN